MLYSWKEKFPVINSNTFITEGNHIVGDVTIGPMCSIWYGAVLRGDDNYITIGEGSNVQDNCVIHVGINNKPTIIGNYVTIGHSAIVHGAKVGDNVLIGMGAIIMDGAVIGKNTIIAAGTLVPQGKSIPEGVLCVGSPAKIIRTLNENEILDITKSAKHYINLWKK